MDVPDLHLLFTRPLDQAGLARRRRVEMEGGEGVWMAPPEYVILRKLEYYREGESEKHLRDIQGMLGVSADQIDPAAVLSWAQRLGLADLWARVRNTP